MVATGCFFYSLKTRRFLFLLRNNTKTRDTWGIPGGKLHSDENTMTGLIRELNEELGSYPEILKHIPLETFTSMDDEFKYHSFIFVIENEFIPILNNEHAGYCWCSLEKYPKPLHPGVFASLNTEVILDKIKLVEELTS